MSQRTLALVFTLVFATVASACGGSVAAGIPATPSSVAGESAAAAGRTGWKAPADQSKAKDQAASFQTYGMPDSWANYGESIAQFCAKHGFTACKRTDTDMSSNEEITRFDAEKNNPVAIMADIGMLYGPAAETKKVTPDFLPAAAAKLPAGMKAKTGGWFGTFVGVPGFVVNTDVIKNVPRTWADLLKSEYKGKIGFDDPRKSGTAATTFIAWAFANGGDENNLQPGIDFAKKLLPNIKGVAKGNNDSLEKGEIPIQIKYDFNLVAASSAMKKKNINTEVVIPGVSIYAPSALMLDKYAESKMDLAKLFSEWVLSDEGQTIFAKFGARPVRYVIGDLKLPDDAKTGWLPDSAYTQVKQVNDWAKVDPAKIADLWENQVLAGQ